MFLYALVMNAPISFLHLFLRSLNEVHRSASTGHALFFSVFIHQILLYLGLEDFLTSKSVHIVSSVGATFLRQRATHLRPSSKRPRVEPSGTTPPPPPSTIGTTSGEASVDPIDDVVAPTVPPPSAIDDFDSRHTLKIVMTIQAAHGQLLVDMLDEIHALRADLEHLRHSPLPPPFND